MRKSLAFACLLSLAACSSPKIEAYDGRKPTVDIRRYLNGNVDAWGVFMNRSGMVDRQFHVALKCRWKGNEGTLNEHFTYSDGKTEDRIWTVHFTDDHHFTAGAHDVVGMATGAQFGNAVNMSYVLRVPVDGTTYDVSMDDWMYLMDNQTLINRTTMRKFGVKLGEVFITFRKKS